MSQSRAPLAFPKLATARPAPPPPPDWGALLERAGVTVDPQQLAALQDLVTLLLGANQLMNLTAAREPEAVWRTMIFDALTLSPLLEALPEGAEVADVGCGGGFPGLPLAILFPNLRFSLIDATAKKIAFVNHAAAQLRLAHATGVVGRAEVLGAADTGKYRERFDLVMARAVAPLRILLELTAPLARAPKEGAAAGRLALVKGERADEELKLAQRAIDLLDVTFDQSFATPTGQVLLFAKSAPCAPRYPRSNGAFKRSPL